MIFNQEMLGKWQKYCLDNGNTIYLRERKNNTVSSYNISAENKELIRPKRKIIVNNMSKAALGYTTIILTDSDNNFLGLCEFAIRDKEAGLTSRETTEYKNMDLPEELEDIRDEIQSNSDAIFVNKELKQHGIGTQLLIIGFEYLHAKGIDKVSVASAIQAREFYKKTGANFNSDADINYTNLQQLKELLSNKISFNNYQGSNKKSRHF